MSTWTPPKTWVTGELVDDTALNTYLRDNMLYLKQATSYQEQSYNAAYTLTTPAPNTTTGWVPVDATNLSLNYTSGGGLLLVGATLGLNGSVTNSFADIDIELDAVRIGGDGGLLSSPIWIGKSVPLHTWRFVPGVAAGPHTLRLMWRVTSASTSYNASFTIAPTLALPRVYVMEFTGS